MFCKKCANEIDINAQFCQKCGSKVGELKNPDASIDARTTNMKATGFIGKTFNIFNTKSAYLFGVLIILVGLQNVSYLISGIAIILGTFVYKSAKNRIANPEKSALWKPILEISILLLILTIIGFQSDIKRIVVEDPFPNVMIPAGIITAYVFALWGNRFGHSRKKKIGIIMAILVGVFLSLVVFVQLIPNSENEITSAQQSEMSWQEFSPTERTFNVSLPTIPTYEFSTYKAESSDDTSYNQELYQSRVGDNLFIIKRITYPSPVDLKANPEGILNSMVNFVIQSTPSATLVNSKFADSFPNKFIDFSANTTEGVKIKGRFILADQVIYQLYLYTTESEDENYYKFINSFENN